ncbi:MAG: ATP-binding protein [Ignisphaera sp.]|nr:ATP-binding protein [Ignisphaera sp.]MCX8167981.1 ATP-binding protein [Ignisphaera sp.]MDW8085993.1 ATP-binding protein [Ignisphaera sp.]
MDCSSNIIVGRVGSESTPIHVEIISKRPIPLGTYVTIPFESLDVLSGAPKKHCLVGIVSRTGYKKMVPTSPTITVTSMQAIGIEDELLKYSPSIARIISDVCEDGIGTASIPPPPDTHVFLAPSEILSRIFSRRGDSSIRIGHLISRTDVEIYLDVNALVKHLFITGTTGSGKSNTVALLADKIASLGGTVIIFDVHGEYSSLKSMYSDVHVHAIDYRLNPLKVHPRTLARMIIPEAAATIQRSLIANALSCAKSVFEAVVKMYGVSEEAVNVLKKPNPSELAKLVPKDRCSSIHHDFKSSMLDDEEGMNVDDELAWLLKEYIKSFVRNFGKGRDEAAVKACAKVDEFFEYAAISFATPQPIELIAPSSIIMVNASSLNDEQRDYSLKIVLDELLRYVRSRLLENTPSPTLVFIEEAHLFLNINRATVSKTSIERVAREGRKFGLSLAIVSQRPRNIDPNTLSQIQNFVFMKLVQESDQLAVMNISDMLTEDLAYSLSSMNVGEALILGEWIGRFPAYVKIERHLGKSMGSSLDIASIWRASKYRRDASSLATRIDMDAYGELKNLLL